MGVRKVAKSVAGVVGSRMWIVGRVVVCLVVAAALCVLPVYLNNIYGYVPIIAFVLVIALCFAYLQILRRSFHVEELSAFTHCQRGQEVDFAVRLANKSVLPHPRVEVRFFVSDLFGGEDSLNSSVVTLAPREVRDFLLDIRFDHIGRYNAGLQEIVVYDPLGLFRATLPGTRSCCIEVTPCIHSVGELEVQTEETLEAAERVLSANENSMDYATVRDYVPGDPLKAIHWKLSARTEGYLTRLYESYSNPSIDVVLDLCAPKGFSPEQLMCFYDALVETAFSLKAWAHERGMASRLVYRSNSGEDRSVEGKADVWSVLELLQDMPRVSSDEASSAAAYELLERESRSLYSSNIVLVTSRLDQDMVQAAIAARGPKKKVVFFGVMPDGFDQHEKADYTRYLRPLESLGIPAYALSAASELEEVRSAV